MVRPITSVTPSERMKMQCDESCLSLHWVSRCDVKYQSALHPLWMSQMKTKVTANNRGVNRGRCGVCVGGGGCPPRYKSQTGGTLKGQGLEKTRPTKPTHIFIKYILIAIKYILVIEIELNQELLFKHRLTTDCIHILIKFLHIMQQYLQLKSIA